MSDTPRTTAARRINYLDSSLPKYVVDVDTCEQLEREIDAAKRDSNQLETQCKVARIQRANAESDRKQADTDTIRALHERNGAREQRDRLADAMREMLPFIEEDYYPNCTAHPFAAAVMKYSNALASVETNEP